MTQPTRIPSAVPCRRVQVASLQSREVHCQFCLAQYVPEFGPLLDQPVSSWMREVSVEELAQDFDLVALAVPVVLSLLKSITTTLLRRNCLQCPCTQLAHAKFASAWVGDFKQRYRLPDSWAGMDYNSAGIYSLPIELLFVFNQVTRDLVAAGIVAHCSTPDCDDASLVCKAKLPLPTDRTAGEVTSWRADSVERPPDSVARRPVSAEFRSRSSGVTGDSCGRRYRGLYGRGRRRRGQGGHKSGA